MKTCDPNAVGAVTGFFIAGCHAVWALLVALGFAQSLLDFIFRMHFLENPYLVGEFNLTTAVMLVLVTFGVGYVAGYIATVIWNWKVKK